MMKLTTKTRKVLFGRRSLDFDDGEDITSLAMYQWVEALPSAHVMDVDTFVFTTKLKVVLIT